ncbi:unnamed protein product, partial [Pocillopora meandrina]
LTGDEWRIILFEEPKPHKVIKGHVIRSEEVVNEGFCRMMCYDNSDMYNVKPLQGGKDNCELNNATADESQLVFLELETFNAYYLAVENPCSSSPCLNRGTCQVGFTSKGFRCLCVPGYAGANCSGTVKSS